MSCIGNQPPLSVILLLLVPGPADCKLHCLLKSVQLWRLQLGSQGLLCW